MVKIPRVAAINFPFHNGPLIGERKVCSSCRRRRRSFVPDLFTESHTTPYDECARTHTKNVKIRVKCPFAPMEVTTGWEGV